MASDASEEFITCNAIVNILKNNKLNSNLIGVFPEEFVCLTENEIFNLQHNEFIENENFNDVYWNCKKIFIKLYEQTKNKKKTICFNQILKFDMTLQGFLEKYYNLPYYDAFRKEHNFNKNVSYKGIPLLHLVSKISENLLKLHNLGIFHCDIKPANIAIKETSLLFADWGFCIYNNYKSNLLKLMHKTNNLKFYFRSEWYLNNNILTKENLTEIYITYFQRNYNSMSEKECIQMLKRFDVICLFLSSAIPLILITDSSNSSESIMIKLKKLLDVC